MDKQDLSGRAGYRVSWTNKVYQGRDSPFRRFAETVDSRSGAHGVKITASCEAEFLSLSVPLSFSLSWGSRQRESRFDLNNNARLIRRIEHIVNARPINVSRKNPFISSRR